MLPVVRIIRLTIHMIRIIVCVIKQRQQVKISESTVFGMIQTETKFQSMTVSTGGADSEGIVLYLSR